jgi:hypothetical protein
MRELDYIGILSEPRNYLILGTPKVNCGELFLCWHMLLNKKTKYRSDILLANARHEFEQARYEQDAEIRTRLLLVGRDALSKTLEKVCRLLSIFSTC